MKKPLLRTEKLAELASDELRQLAGAVPNGGTDPCTIIISRNSCACIGPMDGGRCNIDVSGGSCGCITT